MDTIPTCCDQPMRDDTSAADAGWGVAAFTCTKCGRRTRQPLPAEPGKASLAAIAWPADKPEPALCFVPAKLSEDLWVKRTAQSAELLAHCAAQGLQYKELFVYDFGRLTRVQVAGHCFDVATETLNRPAPVPKQVFSKVFSC